MWVGEKTTEEFTTGIYNLGTEISRHLVQPLFTIGLEEHFVPMNIEVHNPKHFFSVVLRLGLDSSYFILIMVLFCYRVMCLRQVASELFIWWSQVWKIIWDCSNWEEIVYRDVAPAIHVSPFLQSSIKKPEPYSMVTIIILTSPVQVHSSECSSF